MARIAREKEVARKEWQADLGFGPSEEERGKAKRPAGSAEKQGRLGKERMSEGGRLCLFFFFKFF